MGPAPWIHEDRPSLARPHHAPSALVHESMVRFYREGPWYLFSVRRAVSPEGPVL